MDVDNISLQTYSQPKVGWLGLSVGSHLALFYIHQMYFRISSSVLSNTNTNNTKLVLRPLQTEVRPAVHDNLRTDKYKTKMTKTIKVQYRLVRV